MAETRTKASVAPLVPPMRSRKEDEVRRSASSEVTAAVDAAPEVPEIPEVPAVAGPESSGLAGTRSMWWSEGDVGRDWLTSPAYVRKAPEQ